MTRWSLFLQTLSLLHHFLGLYHKPPHRILIVDDEELMRGLLTEVFTNEGHGVTAAVNGEQAIDLLESHSFNLIITDCNMPGVGGHGVVAAANRIDPRCPIIVLSGHPCSEGEIRLISHPRAEYVPKPFGVELIRRTAAKFLET